MTRELPDWNCPTPEKEKAFKEFIFAELDRKLGAEMDAIGAILNDAPLDFADWAAQPVTKRGRGRPPVHPVERQFVSSEEAALLVPVIRGIFRDHWGRHNRGRPSAAKIAAEYVGTAKKAVEVRLKRARKRRPGPK